MMTALSFSLIFYFLPSLCGVPKEVERAGLDLGVLTETKLKGKGQELSGEYVPIWSGLGRDVLAKAGVSILIKKHLKNKITYYAEISERNQIWQNGCIHRCLQSW
ncbi:unnamed protein product [Nezara viridula]|uniref:Neuropeptide n=1 Tax=Nezara viridula TaxID=85310 RepID=A0A9P0EH51_NEZVI|nr:unnamed protein product [Nezara viridula]